MGILNHIALISAAFVILQTRWSSSWPMDPTLGFLRLPLNKSNFHIQKPYDLKESERYSFKHGVHKMWVYFTDKPLYRNSPTHPRTEIRITGYDYSSGVWQFEGYGYVPCGTANVTIMQVFGGSPHATTFMLRVDQNGTLTYYRSAVLASNMYDRWFRLNVIHDANASHLKVYIDGVLKFEAPGRGGTSHYFKCGVYSQPDGSYYMESRWKGIKVLKKSG
ncbi:citrate-binding protein-like [Pyrus ussuriensis x Pyrus communis]|uniref:Citrate-binding protein-like n=1 Tax=Pyrus ussuriensis x Pyrus communis TaxID=2448454 RepID=A0A5N5GNW8_9ROSA|nr:citrate-binding protein-like [Pyrus ussuriensis x Pyrus communis]